MSETRYEVWWSGKKEWAEPCELITRMGPGENVRIAAQARDMHIRCALEVPPSWLHPVEPEIAPGTPCYGFDGIRRFIGFYHRRKGNMHELVSGPNGQNIIGSFSYVEPIAQQPEIDWDKIPAACNGVAVMESGRVISVFSTQHKPGENYELRDHFVRIIPRPKS